MNDPARDCEASHIGRDRVSTVVVLRDGVHTSAACVGPELGMAMAREALAQRLDECRAGGPHVFEAMDPRDADTWGRTGLRCVECGAAPKEER